MAKDNNEHPTDAELTSSRQQGRLEIACRIKTILIIKKMLREQKLKNLDEEQRRYGTPLIKAQYIDELKKPTYTDEDQQILYIVDDIIRRVGAIFEESDELKSLFKNLTPDVSVLMIIEGLEERGWRLVSVHSANDETRVEKLNELFAQYGDNNARFEIIHEFDSKEKILLLFVKKSVLTKDK